ncbi:hypothetical protein [Gloeocapsopsis dulcis]|uniref:hypothetical protein n=1 Tax=Gloeocapsopsis dulcis TaxID=2859516 RepID=UPI0018C46429|nr:hypothetical protein [Gloeocapsopsis dulcis]WNN88651.1 hypothetical protein P0S91_20605 [Gloeocapsopsis dulcis]
MTFQQNRQEFLKLSAASGLSLLLGNQMFQTESVAQATPENPNVAIIKRYYEAYSKGDLSTVRSIFAPNIS